ncbi:CehA/McbA family metallohydrolase [Aliifodinibius sp. S!AR15-10]|uniref:CehA/McbA family metallohydrolase n=1 Tax=Aliifodinibius sp. S!AR15-10 TaxID=2950437 RepID=UPI00286162C1|nr:CehA/McbA family metallohydrolase [Aliifodinibius sp. S!AR15-10]MDR8391557.1 CehA/McbA family metallohydrolase [Aliifodinibius sp. S!AR15-10]
MMLKKTCFLIILISLVSIKTFAQWTNRYPKVEGFSHQIYLEGFELPIMNAGPMDPAPSPSGDEVAFSARGWLWIMDLETGEAERVTQSPASDSRPEWSPDGDQLVFIRDNTSYTQIVLLERSSGEETVIVDDRAINLDPSFSDDGESIYYASSAQGVIDLWRVGLDSLKKDRLIQRAGIQRRPIELLQDSLLLQLNKQGSYNTIERLNLGTGEMTSLLEGRIASQADYALSPDRKNIVYTWPDEGGYELHLMELSTPSTSILLTKSEGLPLAPAFGPEGNWIYFSEAGNDERMQLKRISVNGGTPEMIEVKEWDWGESTGRLIIKSTVDGKSAPVRLNIRDESGHPVLPDSGTVRFDGENGRTFFYSDGKTEVTLPAGKVTISAVHGFETHKRSITTTVAPNEITEATIDLQRVWDAEKNGWYSGDNHFHLNYGGTYRLAPQDMLLDMKGEALDVAFPLLANLHNRFLQKNLWEWSYHKGPILNFGQEVRSHFLGHVALIGNESLFWPWIWGPGYQVYGDDDRTNATALQHVRSEGGLGGYVHPISIRNPFTDGGVSEYPINFIADAVLGEVNFLEVACMWTDEIGTAELWHTVLNLGIPLSASGGSDVMNDYFRTMAVGATRVYVKPDGALTTGRYLDAVKKGKSFVTNGPMLEFSVNGQQVGEVIKTEESSVSWNLEVHSAVPYDSVSIFINGEIVDTREGNNNHGSKSYSGSIDAPTGGWITARVSGGEPQWPMMDSYPFAETSPIWFDEVGSTDPHAKKEAAEILLKELNEAEQNMKEGYSDTPIPNLMEHFQKARERLNYFLENSI